MRRSPGTHNPHPRPSPGGSGGWAWALLIALFASGPVLAQDAPPPPAPEEVPDASEGGEDLTELEEEPPLEDEAAVAEEDEYKEPLPEGYIDSTGNLDNMEDAGQLRVSVRSGTMRAQRGFTPLEVILHNSDVAPRPVRLIFRGYGSGSSATTRTVELAPRQRLVTYLLLPAAVQSGSFSVESPGLPTRVTGVYLDHPEVLSALVLGTAKTFEAGTALKRNDESVPALVDTRFLSGAEAPRELAAYVGYDAVMVLEDVAGIPSDVWAALENYTAVGGTLLLALPPRDVGQRLPLLPAPPPQAQWTPYGFGKVYLCHSGPEDCGRALASVSTDSFPVNPVGPPPRWAESRMALRDGEKPLLPNALAPVGRFLVLIFLFTLVVGPGGLMLARRKGPVALLLGVPAVALVTCLIIIGDSVLGDGFVTHAARYSYTWLDRPRDRVVTAAVAGYYANLSPASVQVPATGVLLAPTDLDDWSLDVDWVGGGMKVEGFLPARTYLEWGEVSVAPTRARLSARREGSTVRVQNALGAPLQSGYLRLGGKHYSLPALADGAEGVATEAPELEGKALDSHAMDRPTGMQRRTHVPEGFTQPLGEGDFLVRMGGGGFTALAALPVQLHEGLHFVRGKVDAP